MNVKNAQLCASHCPQRYDEVQDVQREAKPDRALEDVEQATTRHLSITPNGTVIDPLSQANPFPTNREDEASNTVCRLGAIRTTFVACGSSL